MLSGWYYVHCINTFSEENKVDYNVMILITLVIGRLFNPKLLAPMIASLKVKEKA